MSLVHTRNEYGNSVAQGQTNINGLQSVQNSVTGVVLKNRLELSTSELLHELHCLPVQSSIVFKLATIMYKILTIGQPNYLCTLLKYYMPHCTLPSANQHLLQQPRFCTEFDKRSFSYLVPNISNNLSLEIKTFSYA